MKELFKGLTHEEASGKLGKVVLQRTAAGL
jgi:hypothetical protein